MKNTSFFKRKKTKEYAVKNRVLMILMGSLVPLVLFIIYFNWFVLGEMNNKIAESSRNALYIQLQNMEKNMTSIEDAMVNITSEQPAFRSLAYGPSSEYDNYVNVYETCQDINEMMYPYTDWWGSAVISIPKEIYRIIYNKEYNANVSNSSILSVLKEMAKSSALPKGKLWYPVKVGDESYLIRVMGYNETYIVGIIDLNNVTLMQNNGRANEAATIFYDENQIYTDAKFIDLDRLQSKENYSFIRFNNKQYMLIGSQLEKSKVKVAYVTPKVTIFKDLSKGHILLLIISIFMILVIPISYEMMKRLFFGPLDQLVSTMDRIREGDTRSSMETEFQEKEFRKVHEAMHDMVNEISQLKIESYEKELKMGKIQLEYYQIQIKPHFYLNCLKHIYGMIEVGKYRDVQRMIILLSKHLRYMLGETKGLVQIREELQYIRNYIELQQIGIEKPPECEISCNEHLEEFIIPAYSLLSFVENSVKHSGQTENALKIKVIAEILKTDKESLLHLSVTDNGQGYDEDILKQLNFQDGKIEENKHLGINNVMQRFKLQYGERVVFSFSNYEGADTEIFVKL
jgi:Predicted signal transduction protein with a C-terminal ATPase domain